MATTYFRKDGWVKTVLGPAVPGAQIYVCAPQPANVSALPPSPLASIFSDVNGLVPITQPLISDGFGHYNYYVAAGLYTEVIGAAGIVQQVYPDQSFGLGNPGPGNPYVAGNNITIIGNVISAVIPPQVTIDLQTNGVDNASQTKLNLQSSDSSVSLSADGSGNTNLSVQIVSPAIVRFSVPKLESLGSIWAESPTLPWSVQPGGIGGGLAESLVQPTASVAGYVKATNTATNTFAAYFNGTSVSTFLSFVKTFKIKAAVFSTTNQRYWLALTNNASPGGGGLESNTPAFNIVGFRYSTSAGDTHWQAYCSTDGSNVTTADTGIAADTTGTLHTFEIRTTQGTPGTIRFYIDGNLVATISTHVPTATTGLTPIAYSESLATTTGVPAIGCNLFYEEFFQ